MAVIGLIFLALTLILVLFGMPDVFKGNNSLWSQIMLLAVLTLFAMIFGGFSLYFLNSLKNTEIIEINNENIIFQKNRFITKSKRKMPIKSLERVSVFERYINFGLEFVSDSNRIALTATHTLEEILQLKSAIFDTLQ